MSDLPLIVAKLGKAQRRVVLSLSGEWGKAACHKTARRMFWGVQGGMIFLVEHKHRTDNCWRLSDLGMQVRNLILTESRSKNDATG